MFKVGQKVFSAAHGEGVVTVVGAPTEMYPVTVKFDSHIKSTFTLEGKQFLLQEMPDIVPMPGMSDVAQVSGVVKLFEEKDHV